MTTILEFKDQINEESREAWLLKEGRDVIWSYRIPGYNVPPPHSAASFRRHPTYCVDIGANVGAFSIYSSSLFKNVIGFEASFNNHQNCVKNISAAECKNVQVSHLAVAKESDLTVQLSAHIGALSGDNSCYNPASLPQWTGTPQEEVSTISLEDIYERYHIDYIDYLKVDCEGSEYPLLMNKDLSKINFLALEFHPGLMAPGEGEELLEFLDSFFNLLYKTGEHIFFYEAKN